MSGKPPPAAYAHTLPTPPCFEDPFVGAARLEATAVKKRTTQPAAYLRRTRLSLLPTRYRGVCIMPFYSSLKKNRANINTQLGDRTRLRHISPGSGGHFGSNGGGGCSTGSTGGGADAATEPQARAFPQPRAGRPPRLRPCGDASRSRSLGARARVGDRVFGAVDPDRRRRRPLPPREQQQLSSAGQLPAGEGGLGFPAPPSARG